MNRPPEDRYLDEFHGEAQGQAGQRVIARGGSSVEDGGPVLAKNPDKGGPHARLPQGHL